MRMSGTKEVRAELIRKLHRQSGGNMSIPDLARRAIDEHLFSDEQLHALSLRAVCEECRRALSIRDAATDLPYAQPVPEDDLEAEEFADGELPAQDAPRRAPIWKQLTLFQREEFERMIAARIKGVNEDLAQVRALVIYYREKWNALPNCADQLEINLW